MTGVPVTPSGSILSHGSDDWATGVLSDRFHISLPVPAAACERPRRKVGLDEHRGR